jgi:subtilisin family serine protease
VDDTVPPAVVNEVVHIVLQGNQELSAVLVELNLHLAADADEVEQRFLDIYHQVLGRAADSRLPPYRVSTAYLRCLLSKQEIRQLIDADREPTPDRPTPPNTIFRIWPDYVLRPLIDHSISTIKADAAGRTYGTNGAGVVWAVLDSGVDQMHPHFSDRTLTDRTVNHLHRDFTYIVRGEKEPAGRPAPRKALVDDDGHGTHVAGIIAGQLPDGHVARIATLQAATTDDDVAVPRWRPRQLEDGRSLAGMAPLARIVSLKVLDSSQGEPRTTSSAIIKALEHVRRVNAFGRVLRIHGVNLSLGCPWFYRDYAAGQSPLCRELDLLVGTGVIAVVSAGNGGYAQGLGSADQTTDLHGVPSTITDPGNADRAITVGSTHRDQPHTFGVTYASSKGPTLDGRLKPDLLAPGEHITSCASGALRAGIRANTSFFADSQAEKTAYYAEDSGTSMAAAHVSGAIAAFLSARPEFMGQPDRIKQLFCDSAISLGRERFFEGHGLVDLMGALARV